MSTRTELPFGEKKERKNAKHKRKKPAAFVINEIYFKMQQGHAAAHEQSMRELSEEEKKAFKADLLSFVLMFGYTKTEANSLISTAHKLAQIKEDQKLRYRHIKSIERWVKKLINHELFGYRYT